MLEEEFLDRHPAMEGSYYILGGKPRNENEAHLRGVILVDRRDLIGVGGYDERIHSYGFEERDLQRRLADVAKPLELNADFISHIPHSDPEETTDVASIRKAREEMNFTLVRLKKKTMKQPARAQEEQKSFSSVQLRSHI